MGTCISLQRNSTLLKKTKHDPKTGHHHQDHANNTKFSGLLRPLSKPIKVLNDPTGDDIYKKYRFGKELGRGEFGVTYQCFNDTNGESFACKKIPKSKLRTDIDVEDVRREVEIMRHLPKHPNIVSYKEVYEDKEAIYLVMELCEGGELFDRIVGRGHYTERAAALVTKTILEVVKVCHEYGVIHRDLKPENFLYANDCENAPLKAIDFGLSIFFEPGQRFGEIVGSPYYMAPEVLRRNYGQEIDVWSAGVILYILLCGVPPFWAESEEGIAQAIVYGAIDFERDPWPRISEDAKDLVRAMLQPNPYDRLTVQQVLESQWIQNADKVPNIPLGERVRTRIKQFSLMNKFKKRVLGVVADNLPDEQVDGIKQMFHMMDKDKNGKLNFEELRDGLYMFGQPVTDHDVQLLLDSADSDGKGMLNCEEFVTLAVHLKKISNDELLHDAFVHFDKDQSGYIEFHELQQSLLDDQFGPTNDKLVQDIIFEADLDKDGRISYPEFKAMMTTGTDWKMSSRQYSRAMLNALSIRLFKDGHNL
ncbi:Calcium-dependent protein kinase 24 [Castilleja foliolosa]|uniref:non-specific serine/threonine protein kinase n=1 Tax=Castilleja foliolosa TaxID=1961234 RepID=A0ABD3CXB1_9LAMI